MSDTVDDQSDLAHQRKQWIFAKQSFNRVITTLDKSNIKESIIKLFQINLLRYRGLLVRRIMKQQLLYSSQCDVLASLISVINSKIPEVGELLVKRVILQFKKNFTTKSNKHSKTKSSLSFLCQLVNQQVVNEIVLLQILQLLLEDPTNDTVEFALEIVNRSGGYLFKNSKNALVMILNRLRDLLQEDTSLTQKNKQAINHVLRLGRSDFKGVMTVAKELDLVEDDDKQESHVIGLEDDDLVSEDYLSVFHEDNNYLETEKEYKEIQEEVLGSESQDEHEESQVAEVPKEVKVTDLGKSDLLQYQKTVYLTIMSSMSSDEAVHKLLKLNTGKSKEGRAQDTETLADMIIK